MKTHTHAHVFLITQMRPLTHTHAHTRTSQFWQHHLWRTGTRPRERWRHRCCRHTFLFILEGSERNEERWGKGQRMTGHERKNKGSERKVESRTSKVVRRREIKDVLKMGEKIWKTSQRRENKWGNKKRKNIGKYASEMKGKDMAWD